MSLLSQLKTFSLGPRSLLVKCVPAPKSFYQRRAVLAALQKGSTESIEVFKKLQDDSSFIAVTTSPDTAKNLIKSSPLKQIVMAQNSTNSESSIQSTWGAAYSNSGPIATAVNPLPADSVPKETSASIELGLSHWSFTLHIFSANKDYDHNAEIQKNVLHGPWPEGGDETYIQAALRTIPPSVLNTALWDWETGDQLSNEAEKFTGQEGATHLFLGAKRGSAQEAFVRERMRNRAAKRTPKIMRSLVEFAKECRANQRGEPHRTDDVSSPTNSRRLGDDGAQKRTLIRRLPFKDSGDDSAKEESWSLGQNRRYEKEKLIDNDTFQAMLKE
ncbi:hypothetical protein GGR57DRAFT_504870 [Xylariaceae sp. FL1272]|nr:hypothetical protein GGR57DRAFT_504870 [Xylariaceae sp. FL1272]